MKTSKMGRTLKNVKLTLVLCLFFDEHFVKSTPHSWIILVQNFAKKYVAHLKFSQNNHESIVLFTIMSKKVNDTIVYFTFFEFAIFFNFLLFSAWGVVVGTCQLAIK